MTEIEDAYHANETDSDSSDEEYRAHVDDYHPHITEYRGDVSE